MRKLIIISFTEPGSVWNRELLNRLSKKGCGCEGYTVKRFAEKYGLSFIETDLRQWIGTLWGSCDFLFIGAAGIAVRMIAPWVQDKYTDSAVLVMDEKARFVIPLLGGHIGGAQQLAEDISFYTGASLAATTATDVQGKFAVDVFAKKNHLYFTDRQLAKQISAAVLEGKQVGFFCEYPLVGKLPGELVLCETPARLFQFEYGIFVAENRIQENQNLKKILCLMPKDFVVGLGCRRGVSYEKLKSEIERSFKEQEWDTERICALVSIDLKRNEEGILELSRRWRVPFVTYSAPELLQAEITGEGSAFVEQVTGVDNVCGRAAKRYCMDGEIILAKTKLSQTTVSVVKKNRKEWKMHI